ncbi:tetratricopeptide repeat protein [Shewanella maritima]|uniref:tetratricopeptide repeat protein n=1 Tax=Shewanella maritima TaxID=2520507 RepID=UPI0037351093
MLRIILVLLAVISFQAQAELEAIDIYGDEELISLIRSNQYLQRVKDDDCQLVQDIEARAEVLQQPMYQFLWGEMLNHGVCVERHSSRGMKMLQTSADQGSAEAMLRLARYYYQGNLVVKDRNRAVNYVIPAAANGNVKARILLVRLFGEGYGSPRDYELGYHWLYNSYFDDKAQHTEAMSLLDMLAAKMPESIVRRAQQSQIYTQ